MVDSLGKIVKRSESTSNHYGNTTTEERCVIQLLISSEVALQKICSYCRKCAQNMQKICGYCRKYAAIAENVHKICRKSAGIAENLQVLQKMCRKVAGITENLQKICSTFSAILADFLQLLHIFCNTCRFSAIVAYLLARHDGRLSKSDRTTIWVHGPGFTSCQ